ncbi:MAG: cytochrome-c oxidase, cbb3-type subunit III [Pseudomonadales bacterium]|nr:cytochrome-c oxidase, cbb3-type subunit III [Pseudomonadales bacterium]
MSSLSSFWHWWIIVLTLGCIALIWWLLQSNQTKVQSSDDTTTGHEYDGIQEYDNPLPSWWYWMFVLTIVFALAYLTLYPGLGNYKGLLNWTSVGQWQDEQDHAAIEYAPIFERYGAMSFDELATDPEALKTGQRLFANNCAICHGSAATGSVGFPNLTDDDWLYGDSPEAIETSILSGRQGAMMAWGAALGEQGVKETAAYVSTLSGGSADAALTEKGKQTFDTMCIACHGADGKGNQLIGAPNLTNGIWLYGGTPAKIEETIRNGRNGQMPAHEALLGKNKVHVLAAYVRSLSKSQ